LITLYAFGPAFGLPDPSPFVVKAMVLLKMAGLPYQTDTGGLGRAPKGKLPYIRDGDRVVADSTFIRWHLQEHHGAAFDARLSEDRQAQAWAIERMLEDHFYWAVAAERWLPQENSQRYVAGLPGLPGWLRNPLGGALLRGMVRRQLRAQGLGRHSREDMLRLARRDVDALARCFGDGPYFGGAQPCGADATVYAFTLGALCPAINSPLREAVQAHPILTRYTDRMTGDYFS